MYPSMDRLTPFARPLVLALVLVSLALSRAAASQFRPPMIPALANGQMVQTLATDSSDPATAAALGVNLAPPLAGAIGVGATSARFQVTNFQQPDVLSQVPQPVGPGNNNPSYSPLWQVVRVTWNSGTRPSVLQSEADVMARMRAGQVTIQPTGIVIDGPVVSTPSGGSIMPLALLSGFAEGDNLQNILTDTNDRGFASVAENQANPANFAPKLSRLLGSSATLELYKFAIAGVFNNPHNPNQLTFFDTHPQPVGPSNTNATYTPMWQAVAVHFTFTVSNPSQYPVITSSDQLDSLETQGRAAESSLSVIVNCPIVGVGGPANF